MATKSPTPFHNHWGSFTNPAQLPNVLGSPNSDAALEVGDIAFSLSDGTLYTCTTATVGAAVWSGGASGSDSLPGISDVLFVDMSSVLGLEDGTVQNPYHSIQDALDRAALGSQTTIMVYPGTYFESLTTTKVGMSIIAVGGPGTVTVQSWVAGNPPLTLAHDSTTFTGIVFDMAAISAGALETSADVDGCKFYECVFYVSAVSSESPLYITGFYLDADFYNCNFLHSDSSNISISSNDADNRLRFFDCTVTGTTYVYSGHVKFRQSSFLANPGASEGTITIRNSNPTDKLYFEGCEIESISTTGFAMWFQTSPVGDILDFQFRDCEIISAGTDKDIGASGSVGFVFGIFDGCRMKNGGIPLRVGDRRGNWHVGASYEMDYFTSLNTVFSMAKYAPVDQITVYLHDDVTLSGDARLEDTDLLKIVGNGRTITLSSLYEIKNDDYQDHVLIFDNVNLIGGRVEVGSNGNVVKLINGTRLVGGVYGQAGSATDTGVIIQNSSVYGDNGKAAIEINDADLFVLISDSFIKGDDASGVQTEAVLYSVDNNNLEVVRSVMQHGDGASIPLSVPAAPVTYKSFLTVWSVDPDSDASGNWANTYGAVIVTEDLEIANVTDTITR